VKFYFTGTEILYDNNANLSKAVAAKRLHLTILWWAAHVSGTCLHDFNFYCFHVLSYFSLC